MKKFSKIFAISITAISCITLVICIIIYNQHESIRLSERDGLSAYQLAVEYGYGGSVNEWIDDLSEKSSYDIVQDSGFDKSENDWLNLIKKHSIKENISIKSVEISQKGELIINLTDNTKINIGKTYSTKEHCSVKEIKILESEELVIITDDYQEYNIGAIKGEKTNYYDKGNNVVNAEITANGDLDIMLDNGEKLDVQYNKSNTPSIYIEEIKANAGDIVEIPVCLFNNSGINGAEFDISYDSKLRLIEAENGKALKSLNYTAPANYSNPCKFLWDGINEDEKGNGVALILKFELPSDARINEKFNVSVSYPKGSIYDVNLEDVNFDTVNGSITIK